MIDTIRERWRRSGAARRAALAALAVGVAACGDDGGPTGATGIRYGETALVALVNPTINTINNADVAAPDTVKAGVHVVVAGGPSADSDSLGVAVLAPVAAGAKAVKLSRADVAGEVSVEIAQKDLREVAIAYTPGGSSVMANVLYAFGGQVVEVDPGMSINEVNAALSRSNLIVFFRRGVYRGDLTFSGSSVTLYGEGPRGGTVTIEGNVTVNGSGNRIRGAHITGNLTVPASNVGISFTRVDGALSVSGSSANFLHNSFCGTQVSISASNVTALGNRGLDPLPRAAHCPS